MQPTLRSVQIIRSEFGDRTRAVCMRDRAAVLSALMATPAIFAVFLSVARSAPSFYADVSER